MNFLPMRYFIAMADQKSISKAVRQLHIIQQTLSAHIRGRVWMPALIAARRARRQDIAGGMGELLQKAGLVSRIAAISDNAETLLDLCVNGVGA